MCYLNASVNLTVGIMSIFIFIYMETNVIEKCLAFVLLH